MSIIRSCFRRVQSYLTAVALGVTLLLGANTPANAVVVSTFDILSAEPLYEGDSLIARLTLSLTPDSGYYNAAFAGGTATIYDGAGGSQSFNIGSGGTTRQFDFTTALIEAGSYIASFVLNAIYTQQYSSYEVVNWQYVQVGGYSYSCGWFSTCYQPIYDWVPVYGYITRTTSRSASLSGNEGYSVTTAVPLPAGLPLLAGALAILGLLGWRRKRLASSSVPA